MQHFYSVCSRVVIVLIAMSAAASSGSADSMQTFNQKLDQYLKAEVLPGLDAIPEDRQKLLDEAVQAIREKRQQKKPIALTFICTHNSRRSQFSQVWADIAASYYQVQQTRSYSGGTAVTACNPRTVAALKRAGLPIEQQSVTTNPVYLIRFNKESEPISLSSKVYDGTGNPKKNFIALMCCSDADEKCPVVAGADARIPLHYIDPKVSDGTDQEEETYDERCRQIACEMFYIMSRVSADK